MVDFHVHVGEGGLLPSEAMRYARLAGYKAVGLLVRADTSTLSLLLPWLLQLSRHYSLYTGVDAFAGVELVQVPPALMPEAVAEARGLGAALVVAHGETAMDDVELGTNLAAIEAEVDILAHPGLITAEDAALAGEKGILLELTTAPGHCLTNAHVAAMAMEYGCGMVLNGNVKAQKDFASPHLRKTALAGARVTQECAEIIHFSTSSLVQQLMKQ